MSTGRPGMLVPDAAAPDVVADPIMALVEQPGGVADLDLVTALRLQGRLRHELDRLRDLDHALAVRVAMLQIALQ